MITTILAMFLIACCCLLTWLGFVGTFVLLAFVLGGSIAAAVAVYFWIVTRASASNYGKPNGLVP